MLTLEHVEIVGIFAELFRKDYERMNPADTDINTYLKDFLTDGEYYHRGYHPFKDFLSAVADVTIILPLVESIVGYDFITGEELTGWERALKGGGAIFDIVTLGSSALITNAAKAGAWDVVTKTILKTMAMDAAGSSMVYVTGAALQEMGLPAGTSTVLAAIVSGGITYSAGRYFFKDEAENVIAEYTGAELDRILKGEMDGLERSGLSAIKGIDNLDSFDGVMRYTQKGYKVKVNY